MRGERESGPALPGRVDESGSAAEAEGPRVPGARAVGLVADGRLVWIMRELAGGPLRPVDLRERIPNIPHSTLLAKLELLVDAGAIVREELGPRSTGVLHRLAEAGHALLELTDRVVESSLRSNPGAPQLLFASSPGPPALRVLADDATPALLLALSGPPQRLASLERQLHRYTRSQLKTRLKSLELASFVEREGDRYTLRDTGREASAFVISAARIEERYQLADATQVRPNHLAAVLSVAIPLLPSVGPDGTEIALTVEGDRADGEADATCVVRCLPGGLLEARAFNSAPASTAGARGGTEHWCAALIDGRTDALHVNGPRETVCLLLDDLHRRLFADGAIAGIQRLRASGSRGSADGANELPHIEKLPVSRSSSTGDQLD